MNKYFFEVYENIVRQGPGSNKATRKAYDMIKGYLVEHPKILDIGSGKGIQAFKLAEFVNGHITCVDTHQPFVDYINKKAADEYLQDVIVAENKDMNNLGYREGSFDVIWSEGAIYNIGFEKGLNEFKKYVKSGGFIIVTEAVWLKDAIPADLAGFWNNEYPAITSVEQNIKMIEKCGLRLISHFTLPEEGWTLQYYEPLKQKTLELKEKNKNIAEAVEVYDMILHEISMYEKYPGFYGYEFFILKNI